MIRSQLILGDAVESTLSLPSESVPLTVTSPPFDDLFGLGEHFEFEPLAQQLFRITAPGGILCWDVQDQVIGGSETGSSSYQRLYFRDLGFRLHETIIVASAGARVFDSSVRYPRSFKYVFVLSKGKPNTFNALRDKPNKSAGQMRRKGWREANGELRSRRFPESVVPEIGVRTNIWPPYATGSNMTPDGYTNEHGGRMGEAEASDLIMSYSIVGDLVFDPMNGVGTTTKMALLNHRRYLGIEINPRWHHIAQRRMREAEAVYARHLDEWLEQPA